MKQSVLVVGGAGYVGGYLVDLLIKNWYTVAVYDNLTYETRYLKNVSFIKGDINDYEKLKPIINNFDIVVWLAAVVGDGACDVNPELTKKINTETVKWLVQNYIGKIIFMSTSSVYGISDDELTEESPLNPITLYTKTKLEAERYIIDNHEDYLIFRLGTLFGISDRHSRLRLDLVANIFAQRAAENKPITVNGGNQWRPILHVRDVGNAILHGIENEINGLYNLSYKNFTISDIASTVQDIAPKGWDEVKITHVDIPPGDVRNYKMSSVRYMATGWEPSEIFVDGIREMYWIIKEGRVSNTSDSVYNNQNYFKSIWKPQEQ